MDVEGIPTMREQPIDRLTFRPSETAEALGLSRSKTYELISAGIIPSIKIDGATRVPRIALEQMIARLLAERTEAR